MKRVLKCWIASASRGEEDDKGAALPFVAAILLLLLGISAFAVDLGWMYLNGARLQRAADSSALAGVVYLPGDITNVVAKAVDGASANGWDIGTVNGSAIAGGGPDDLEWQQLADNKLEVTLSTTIPTFFLKVIGFDEFDITRVATAEYIKPVPMGSPSSCFGVGSFAAASLPSNLSHCSAYTMNFWAAINGPNTAKEHGDPFAVACITANSSGCTGGANTDDYRPSGYYYGLEVPKNETSMTVRIFDAAFYDRATFQTETGDGDGLAGSANGGTTTQYFLYAPDATPQNPQDNSTLVCSSPAYGPEYQASNSGLTTKNQWRNLCTVNNPTEGIYVLNVRSTGSNGGNNSYSIGVASSPSSAPHVRVYAINDMSIFTNATSGTAVVYLAEVAPAHAGKILQLSFYDPGENSSNAWVEVKMPNGTTPTCSWVSRNDAGAQTGSGSGSCRIQSTTSGTANFNAQWLTATIDIPDNYTCSSDCFWKMHLDMNNSQDRTTWAARVIGNPVRLVPNQ